MQRSNHSTAQGNIDSLQSSQYFTINISQSMQKMAEKLNSNEQIQLDDRLRVQITTVRDPGQGSGRRKEATPGNVPLMTYLQKKRCVVHIRNQDELCCARANVTMQAWIDEQPPRRRTPEIGFENLIKSRPAQTRSARALHALARVPEGPFGLGALEQFQIVPPDYYIKVLSTELGF